MMPSIQDAEAMARKFGLQGVVIVGFAPDGRFSAASWGSTRANCRALAKLVDFIADRLERANAILASREPPSPKRDSTDGKRT